MENVCVSERRVHVVCVRCVCTVCERVKGERREMCMSIRVQGKRSTQEKSREHRRECRVCAASSCERMSEEEEKREREREREQKMRKRESLEKLPVSLYSKTSLCVFIMHLPDIPASS